MFLFDKKSRPGSRHFKCLNITTPLSNPEHAGFHSPKCIQRASHNSNETKAVYGPRVCTASKGPPVGYADNMISTLFNFASYHQYRTDGNLYID